ncbi:hypothetical protein TREES_T100018614 [Tupaia chinensis]|uniref:Uncharacterized protein n=1 Tax=Tupaia chinensis TaxID=246437 RepID=L9KPV2_TUPCH|nr:hypothetical protein TREES_T100018614 [Tupaia chinensis]
MPLLESHTTSQYEAWRQLLQLCWPHTLVNIFVHWYLLCPVGKLDHRGQEHVRSTMKIFKTLCWPHTSVNIFVHWYLLCPVGKLDHRGQEHVRSTMKIFKTVSAIRLMTAAEARSPQSQHHRAKTIRKLKTTSDHVRVHGSM